MIKSFETKTLDAREGYRLLTSIVVPRPIAWVSSMGSDGSTNLAPFSFFNVVGNSPPTIMISIGERKGNIKDTLRNIKETGEFVINIADEKLSKKMVLTSGDWSYGTNEFEQAEFYLSKTILLSYELKLFRWKERPQRWFWDILFIFMSGRIYCVMMDRSMPIG